MVCSQLTGENPFVTLVFMRQQRMLHGKIYGCQLKPNGKWRPQNSIGASDGNGPKVLTYLTQVFQKPRGQLVNTTESLQRQSGKIASAIFSIENNFDVVELGAGDCSKSIHLLKEIFKTDNRFTFFPVDISKHVIDLIEGYLPNKIEGLNVCGLNGE